MEKIYYFEKCLIILWDDDTLFENHFKDKNLENRTFPFSY
jgi:hypothetical protein